MTKDDPGGTPPQGCLYIMGDGTKDIFSCTCKSTLGSAEKINDWCAKVKEYVNRRKEAAAWNAEGGMLDVSHNDMTDDLMEVIADCFWDLEIEFKDVYVHNNQLSDAGFDWLRRRFVNARLEEINGSHNFLKDPKVLVALAKDAQEVRLNKQGLTPLWLKIDNNMLPKTLNLELGAAQISWCAANHHQCLRWGCKMKPGITTVHLKQWDQQRDGNTMANGLQRFQAQHEQFILSAPVEEPPNAGGPVDWAAQAASYAASGAGATAAVPAPPAAAYFHQSH